jgi:PAS domain S-box-containing protein
MPRARRETDDHAKLLESNRLLRTERNFISAVLETTRALVTVLDPQGRILRWNRACEQITGRTFLDVIGQPFWEVFPDPARILHDGLNRLLAGEPLEYEVECDDPAGSPHCFHWSTAPYHDENGTAIFIICSGIDITLRRRVERERERLIGELQEALARIKTLSGLIPMCAKCKKIRDDRGYWQEVEAYIEARSEAEFSHG